MIIVLGFDNSGKTSTAKFLSEVLAREYIKSPGPIAPKEQKRWIIDHIVKVESGKRTIHDRFPVFEEMIYGPILREKSQMKWGDFYFERLKMMDPIIIYCRPLREVIYKFGDREQYPGIKENRDTLLNAYDELIFKLMQQKWRVIVYDYNYTSQHELMKEVEKEEYIRGMVL